MILYVVMKALENAAICTELNSCHSQVLSRKHSASHPSAREHSLAEHVLAVLAVLTAKSVWSCVCASSETWELQSNRA